MNTDQLRERFPDENACRTFFESIIWRNGRFCPHCGFERSYPISGKTTRPGLYECGRCKGQFTVTTKTPMHSTKLALWKWLLTMYYIVNSSKGISSVFLAKWIGVTQKTAWKLGHAVREMMNPDSESQPVLNSIVELDEKYFGGKPRHRFGARFKRGSGTAKQGVFVIVERHGPVRSTLIDSRKTVELQPLVEQFVEKDAQLMTDEFHSYRKIGQQYASHKWVKHSMEEYARDDVHNNTAESFSSLLERVKLGVFHHMSTQHLQRYLNEIGFRWDHRLPNEKMTKKGVKKIVMIPMEPIKKLRSLLSNAFGRQIVWTKSGGIRVFNCAAVKSHQPLFGI
jgi:transposase-like protein